MPRTFSPYGVVVTRSSSSNWDVDIKDNRPESSNVFRNLTVGLAIASAFVGGTETAFAQEGLAPGSESARVGQNVRNAQAVTFSDLNDLLAKWTTTGHVYAQRADLFSGLEQNDLNVLAQWIRANHPNWTVIFVGDASNERYGVDGTVHLKGRAYEFALGQKLAGSSRFGQIVDKETGVKSGAILWIVNAQNPDDRLKGWVESDLQERFGVQGRSADGRPTGQGLADGQVRRPWSDRYERELTGNLRQAQWINAATNFIQSVERDVTRARDAEQERVAQAKAQAERQAREARDRATTSVEGLERRYQSLQLELKEFRAEFPLIKGALAYPDLDDIQVQIERAREDLSGGRITEAQSTSGEALQILQEASQRLVVYRSDGATLQEVSTILDAHRASEFKHHVKPELEASRLSLSKATSLWKQGDPAYQTSLDECRNLVQVIGDLLQRTQRAGDQIDSLLTGIPALEKHSFYSVGEADVAKARTSLEAAKKLWDRGDRAYLALLDDGRSFFSEAELAITGAEQADAQRRATMTAASVFGSLFVLAGLAWGNLRRTLPKTAAERRYALLDKAIGEKASDLMRFDEFLSLHFKNATFTGQSEEKRNQILGAIPALYVLNACAQRVLDTAEPLIFPKSFVGKVRNMFTSGQYAQAERLLTSEKVNWDEDSQLPEVIRGRRIESRDLWRDLGDYRAFQASFDEILERFNETAKEIDVQCRELEEAQKGCEEASVTTRQSLERLRGAAESDLIDSARFGSEVLEAAEKRILALSFRALQDPLGTIEDFRSATAALATIEATVTSAVESQATVLEAIDRDRAWLIGQGFETAWIDQTIADVRKHTSDFLTDTAHLEESAATSSLGEELNSLRVRVEKARAQGEVLTGEYVTILETGDTEIARTRQLIATTLGIAPDRVFEESGNDPDEFLASTRAAGQGAREALNRGDVDATFNLLREARAALNEAERLQRSSLESLESHPARGEALDTRHGDLSGRLLETESVLESMRENFADSVLLLGAGDVSHPRANDTIADNIVEAREALAVAATKRGEADSERAKGNVLRAAALFDEAEQSLTFAWLRLEEVRDKEARVRETTTRNAAELDRLHAEFGSIGDDIAGDRIITESTVHLQGAAQAVLELLTEKLSSSRPDPFVVEQEIAKFGRDLAAIRTSMANDRENYETARERLGSAKKNVLSIEDVFEDIERHGTRDSDALRLARQDLAVWNTALGALSTSLERDRQDWSDVAREADRIVRKGVEILRVVQGEEDDLADALKMMKSAEAKIREARGWSGRYGVTLSGSPGQNALSEAQRLLMNGSFEEALRRANTALDDASDAIEEAEREVSRRRRAEEERQRQEEEARRQREREERERREEESRRSSYSSSSSSSSSWGSDSGGSSSSFSSSSDSGGSSSGW